MPSYIYDQRARRYRDAATGNLVPERQVRSWLAQTVDEASARMRQVTQHYLDDDISEAEWELEMRKEIKNGHKALAAMAVGGLAMMTLRDWGRVGQVVQQQNGYMLAFGADVIRQQVSDDEMLQRAGLYGAAMYATHENLGLLSARDRGATLARRVVDEAADHCEECPDLADEGWQPIDEITPIGDTPCMANCRCIIEYGIEGDLEGDEAAA